MAGGVSEYSTSTYTRRIIGFQIFSFLSQLSSSSFLLSCIVPKKYPTINKLFLFSFLSQTTSFSFWGKSRKPQIRSLQFGSNFVLKVFSLYRGIYNNFPFVFSSVSSSTAIYIYIFMGNIGSSGNGSRRNGSRRNHPPPPRPPTPAQPQPEIAANRYVFAAATPYPPQYTNTNPHQYYQYPGYYSPQPPVPLPLPSPYDHHHRGGPHMESANWSRYAYGPMMPPPPVPYIEHQKAVTIRNDVNLKKETLKLVPDEENPGKFLVSFTFDATLAGSDQRT